MSDALYLIPHKEKSYGLINYQYAKTNNISPDKNLYIYDSDTKIDKDKKEGKFFIYMDDFSGSGQSLVISPFSYINFRFKNPAQPFIFAPMSYTKQAFDRINRAIFSAKLDLKQRVVNDCVVGVTKIDDMEEYIRMLPVNKRQLLKYCFHKGYTKGSTVVGFPHVIPDNCSDSAGILLEKILKNPRANKAKTKVYKKDLINYITEHQNN